MNRPACIAAVLLLGSIGAGTLSQTSARRAPILIGGYRVLSADFHVHTFPFNWTTLAPWDVLLESQRHGLDAVLVAGHNFVWISQFAGWCSRLLGGPIAVPGEEIVSPRYHLIAVGVTRAVNWRRPAAAAIADVHRQGGFAIAAHPEASFWPAFDENAMAALDAAEVLHPDVYSSRKHASEIRQFFNRKPMTAIGSSDFHALGYPGECRTYVFVRQADTAGILEALRAGRTVVYNRNGPVYGDPALIQLAAREGRLPEPDPAASHPGPLAQCSKIAALAALLIAVLFRGSADGRS